MKGRGLRKLEEGMILEISPAKIPRVIGRRGSMINMIQDVLQIDAMVGQNGLIWIRARDNEVLRLAINAFKMIESQAHTSKLTDRVKAMLEEGMKAIRGEGPPDGESSEESIEPEETVEAEEAVPTDLKTETEAVEDTKEDAPEEVSEVVESEETEIETKEEVSE